MNKAVQLLIEWDEFDQVYPQADLERFCRYYLAKKEELTADSQNSPGLLLKIMGRISSAYSLYHRAAMSKTKLPSPESFYFLNGLAYLGEVKKTDLINYLFYEYTTGMEVISKLLKENLILEKVDLADKRAKLISLTAKGKQVLSESYMLSTKVSEMVFNGMKDDSIKLCIELLKNIEEKHSKWVPELKNKEFDEMYHTILK